MDVRPGSGHRMFDPSRHGRLTYLVQHSGEIFSEPRISRVTGGLLIAILEQLIEPQLRGFRVIERHTICESNQTGEISAPRMFAMTPHVNLRGIGSERTAIEIDLVIAHRGANLIDVIDEVGRRVLAKIKFF